MQFVQHDLGQQSRGATVVVRLGGNAANVRLMDGANFRNYRAGRRHRYLGGLVTRSPFRMVIPRAGHWYVTVDLAGLRGQVKSSVQIEPPPLPAATISPMTSPLSQIQHDPVPAGSDEPTQVWDVFISHASEDKDSVARPLAEELRARGISVWLDELELKIGDSLRRKIDSGLRGSRFGVVILSPSFFSKGWTQYELDGLITRSVAGGQSVLPLWHDITKAEVVAYSPSLADRIARSTAQYTIEEIAQEIADVVVPDMSHEIPG
jgi:hypothetical protein